VHVSPKMAEIVKTQSGNSCSFAGFGLFGGSAQIRQGVPLFQAK